MTSRLPLVQLGITDQHHALMRSNRDAITSIVKGNSEALA